MKTYRVIYRVVEVYETFVEANNREELAEIIAEGAIDEGERIDAWTEDEFEVYEDRGVK